MAQGIGVDIVSNSRFLSPSQKLLERLFSSYEIEEGERREVKNEYYASRFAVKEAVVKAMGTGFRGISPKSIETRENEEGKPYILINGKEAKNFLVSLSHEKECSIAFVIMEEK